MIRQQYSNKLNMKLDSNYKRILRTIWSALRNNMTTLTIN